MSVKIYIDILDRTYTIQHINPFMHTVNPPINAWGFY